MDMDKVQNAGLIPLPDAAANARSTARLPTFERDVVRPAYLAHIVLSTHNVPGMSAWYQDVLGAESTFSSKGFRAQDPAGNVHVMENDFVTFDQEHHRVAFANVGGKPNDAPPVRTLNHIAFTYAHIGDLVSTYKRLSSDGILPVRTVHHGPTISNYYLDPDGNRVELQIEAFPSVEALTEWFDSGAFNKNSIGFPFDFNILAERFDLGDDPAYLIDYNGFIVDYTAGKLK